MDPNFLGEAGANWVIEAAQEYLEPDFYHSQAKVDAFLYRVREQQLTVFPRCILVARGEPGRSPEPQSAMFDSARGLSTLRLLGIAGDPDFYVELKVVEHKEDGETIIKLEPGPMLFTRAGSTETIVGDLYDVALTIEIQEPADAANGLGSTFGFETLVWKGVNPTNDLVEMRSMASGWYRLKSGSVSVEETHDGQQLGPITVSATLIESGELTGFFDRMTQKFAQLWRNRRS